MSNIDYKAAYARQKKAREQADKLLEDKSRELYEANTTLTSAYNRLKQQKTQLLHQEKLASIGQLAAGVAHEINNPSAYVKSNLTSLNRYRTKFLAFLSELQEELNQGKTISYTELSEKHTLDFLMEDFEDIINDSIMGMDKIASIVRSLRDFSRPDSDEKKLFNPNDAVKNTLKLVWNELKYKAEIVEEYNDLPDIYGFAGGFSQVILNLLINASHAIPEKGTIAISTSTIEGGIKVIVSDTGHGIAPKDLLKIFDPFFTTKDPGKGTGLGLSISQNIIEKHGGRLLASSEIGKGTTFTIELPNGA